MTTTEPASRPARRSKAVTVTATQVGEHLSLTRQRVTVLADVEHVLVRLADGRFDLADCRRRYIEFLRTSRRAQKSKQDEAFLEQKTMALTIRNQQRLGQLVPREVCEAVLDAFVAAVTAELLSIPARAALMDLATRRKLDAVVHDARKSIHARLTDKLAEFEGDGGADGDA